MVSSEYVLGLVVISFFVGLQVGAHFIPSPKTISEMFLGVTLVMLLCTAVVGLGFLAIDLWKKRKKRLANLRG